MAWPRPNGSASPSTRNAVGQEMLSPHPLRCACILIEPSLTTVKEKLPQTRKHTENPVQDKEEGPLHLFPQRPGRQRLWGQTFLPAFRAAKLIGGRVKHSEVRITFRLWSPPKGRGRDLSIQRPWGPRGAVCRQKEARALRPSTARLGLTTACPGLDSWQPWGPEQGPEEPRLWVVVPPSAVSSGLSHSKPSAHHGDPRQALPPPLHCQLPEPPQRNFRRQNARTVS